MDVLQLSYVSSVSELARLSEGTTRPLLVANGNEELMVVLTPRVFEQLLLGRAGL